MNLVIWGEGERSPRDRTNSNDDDRKWDPHYEHERYRRVHRTPRSPRLHTTHQLHLSTVQLMSCVYYGADKFAMTAPRSRIAATAEKGRRTATWRRMAGQGVAAEAHKQDHVNSL
ncbi:hypothetical protein GCM10009554_46370 [Kribbella koreensis]|uniref:Uncharacterized protein n=1 Tax=Kribbella koreensis TaxID=57909 RepID=A0ABP4BFC3_9ACTN